ncbi:MAG: DctP family TRAP transporter solute-binding subunit [Pseudotabrizicola sp.]|uniref:DctP family TRAP transporter solute-binding subunit n=1 Tax=Pseudotabrizicola sp. TaxID=2939647 RepID=UPI002730B10F|nr:DctP family TRAP transporter solute-binding subunit [Pseudotabrizicola sp.]MDP2079677.1 DctP family TRAP transporter solute-binding subunit [Pseudotabrizicola sp.]MDZ7575223.1 DctP family TRAP transporter solute-binding subunit [Pseudotabrizicola sp.]
MANFCTAVLTEEIAQRTEGRYTIQLQGGGALGGDRDVVEGVQFGTVEMTVSSTSVVANFAPDFAVFDVPFLFRDFDHAQAVLDGEVGTEVLGTLRDAGFVGLAAGGIGFRQLTNNVRPVTVAADVAGLKIRTQQNELHLKAWEALGALPTPMAVTEVYSALQQGVVDGQENPVGAIINNRFGEVQKYMSVTNHAFTPIVLLINPGIYDAMSEADQEIFREAAISAMARTKEEVLKIQETGLETLRAGGTEILTEVDSESFRTKLEPTFAELSERFGGRIEAIRIVGQ